MGVEGYYLLSAPSRVSLSLGSCLWDSAISSLPGALFPPSLPRVRVGSARIARASVSVVAHAMGQRVSVCAHPNLPRPKKKLLFPCYDAE